MSEQVRVPALIVVVLRFVGGFEILAAIFYLAIHLITAYTTLEPASLPGTAMGLGMLLSGILFLAVAFIADKLDSIDQRLATRTAAERRPAEESVEQA